MEGGRGGSSREGEIGKKKKGEIVELCVRGDSQKRMINRVWGREGGGENETCHLFYPFHQLSHLRHITHLLCLLFIFLLKCFNFYGL